MEEELLIKNVRIIDADKDINGDVYVYQGKIKKIGNNIHENCRCIDGRGLTLMPSFVDTHAHFREPGYTNKEDILSGSMAAVKGGYTGVNLMANTNPVCSATEEVNKIKEKGTRIGLVDVNQCISITNNFSGDDTSHLNNIDNNIKIISEDGKDVANEKVMLRAMKIAAEKDLIVMCHNEDEKYANKDSRLAENINTRRNINLAMLSGCKVHMAHVSTKESMKMIIDAKEKFSKITCEVTPHHFCISEEECDYKVNPPLREQGDIKYLIKALKEGVVDTLGTDHAPHTILDKEKGACGISGIETAFSLCYTKLVREGYISLNKLSQLMSKRPSELLGFNKGLIEIGYDGDFVLIDMEKQVQISNENLISKGKNTPLKGQTLWGEVVTTIKSGRVVYNRGEFLFQKGRVYVNNWWLN